MIPFPPRDNEVGEDNGPPVSVLQHTPRGGGLIDGACTDHGDDLSRIRATCEGRHRGWPMDRQADLELVALSEQTAQKVGDRDGEQRAQSNQRPAEVLHGQQGNITRASIATDTSVSSGARQGDTNVNISEYCDFEQLAQDPGADTAREGGEYNGVTGDALGNRVGQDNGTKQGTYKTLAELDPAQVKRTNYELKKIFDKVVERGQFNHKGARIPLPSGLHIESWRTMLRGYNDFGIVQYLEYGWPIGIDREAALLSEFKNHASARAFPADIEHYIVTELSHKALLGPFAGPPANTCHFSPLMTRPKKGSLFRRVIIDLSWPRGLSVNDGISRTDYIDGPLTISLPTHDDMERAVVRAGRGAFMYKTDLSRGYRQLRVDPMDWPYLSFQHKGGHFMDICPPFGLRSSAMAMQRVSQAIVHLHGRRGFLSRAYIDDFGGVEHAEHRAQTALETLQGIMDALGVQQAEGKICLPAQVMVWLGISFDTMAMSMTIPQEKMAEIMACLGDWSGKVRATRREIQSLLGLLNFVASVAPPVRLFTNRMLDNLRETPPAGATSLSHQFKMDVRFFQELLPIFNGRKIMGKKVLPYQHQVELDACLTGCGAVAGDQFYATPFPQEVLEAEHTIAHLELLNIVVAVKVWRERWAGWSVQIYCDNLNSVFVLQSGRSRDLFMRECAREVFLHTAACDIELQICHRPGTQMVWADALSREHTGAVHAKFVREDPHLRTATRVQVPPGFFRIDNHL